MSAPPRDCEPDIGPLVEPLERIREIRRTGESTSDPYEVEIRLDTCVARRELQAEFVRNRIVPEGEEVRRDDMQSFRGSDRPEAIKEVPVELLDCFCVGCGL